jgi:aspartyl-tRNA(Asn)/glutamyl-tRNA(Gln) amidotransferase subunit B
MRSKEDAHDYRYFPDPDLLPLAVSTEWMEEVRADLPELPQARRERYQSSFGLSAYDATVLTATVEIGDYFDAVAMYSLLTGEPFGAADRKVVANWVINEVAAKMNAENLAAWQFAVSPATLGHLLRRMREGAISARVTKDLFSECWDKARASNYELQGGDPDWIDEQIDSRGLRQISDAGALETVADQVIAANAQQVADYRGGKEKAFNALVGQVMKATRGKANPQQVSEILKRKLQ